MKPWFWIFVVIALSVTGCSSSSDMELDLSSNVFDFNEGTHGWVYGFSDFPANSHDSILFELAYKYEQVATNGKAISLGGNNRNKDLFFYIKRKLTGLQPNANFTITFEVDVLCPSRAQVTTWGENIVLKAGASGVEPKSVIDAGNFEMNIDKGTNFESGLDMAIIGNLYNSEYSPDEYVTLSRGNTTSDAPFEAKSNAKGELWLVIGADSNYEGVCEVNFSKVSAVLTHSY